MAGLSITATEQRWLQAMVDTFPDVKEGDRLTGLHTPGAGTRFFFNGTLRATVADHGVWPAVLWHLARTVDQRATPARRSCWRGWRHDPQYTVPTAPFDWHAGWRYGLMGLPLAFVALPLYVTLPNHYATAFGVPLATLGAVLLAARLLDALIDPLLGRWSDRLFAQSLRAVLAWAAHWPALVLGAGFALLFFPARQRPKRRLGAVGHDLPGASPTRPTAL